MLSRAQAKDLGFVFDYPILNSSPFAKPLMETPGEFLQNQSCRCTQNHIAKNCQPPFYLDFGLVIHLRLGVRNTAEIDDHIGVDDTLGNGIRPFRTYHHLLRWPAFQNRRAKIELPGHRSDRSRDNPVESLVVDLLDLIDARQTGGKFIDVDQEIPSLLHRHIEIDLTVKNHRALSPDQKSRAILCDKKTPDKSRLRYMNLHGGA